MHNLDSLSLQLLPNPGQALPEQAGLFAILAQHGIATTTYQHAPVFTVAEGAYLQQHIAGTHTKNLFLTNKTGGFWLVVAAETTRIDLKHLSDTLQTPRFSFGKPADMLRLLGVTPGAVTCLGLLQHDTQRQVQVVLDAHLMATQQAVVHPLRNDCSTVIGIADIQRLLQIYGYQPYIYSGC